ncbi:tetratricopeptide repeat family protein [Rhodopirellula islandica]|uniref:Tetratricopeptide repeat family protein n=1 Tax=Rhodopirellula islandica TaxID=595434 RepID=A0A0J1BH91_RHOIS|nr:tetratricopeptide repeat family protein [Rhodopirellula islandica]
MGGSGAGLGGAQKANRQGEKEKWRGKANLHRDGDPVTEERMVQQQTVSA